jgi:hypothetical protein
MAVRLFKGLTARRIYICRSAAKVYEESVRADIRKLDVLPCPSVEGQITASQDVRNRPVVCISLLALKFCSLHRFYVC